MLNCSYLVLSVSSGRQILKGILRNFLNSKLKSITFALVVFFQQVMKLSSGTNQQVLLVHARMKFQHT